MLSVGVVGMIGLVEEIGGPPTPGIGFAMGLERVLAALQVQT